MKYNISNELKYLFEEKVNKLFKKFQKYGKCSYSFSEPYIDEDKNSLFYGKKMVNIDVDASYQIVGYEFVASLEWLDDVGENLIKKISDDVFVPPLYKTRTACDHCKTNRRRKYTVILKKDNEYIQVGKSCVRDYLGVDLSNYTAYLSFFTDLEDFIEYHNQSKKSMGKDYFNVEDVLCQAIEETHRHGYISKKQAIENSVDGTASRVWMALNKSRSLDGQIIYELYKITPELINEANVVKQYYQNLTTSSSDYVNNIKTILKTDWVDGSQVGLVVSAVGTKLRLENEAKEKANKPATEFINANIGDKVEFLGIPSCIYSTESTYGWFYIYRIVDNENHIFIWKTSKNLDTDKEYKFKGSVKGFEQYNDEKQNEITRVRTVEITA